MAFLLGMLILFFMLQHFTNSVMSDVHCQGMISLFFFFLNNMRNNFQECLKCTWGIRSGRYVSFCSGRSSLRLGVRSACEPVRTCVPGRAMPLKLSCLSKR